MRLFLIVVCGLLWATQSHAFRGGRITRAVIKQPQVKALLMRISVVSKRPIDMRADLRADLRTNKSEQPIEHPKRVVQRRP